MSKVRTVIVFDDPVCNIGSLLDGQDLNELIHFEQCDGYANSLFLDTVPKIGETVQLFSNAGAHHFIVKSIHHVITTKYPQYVKLLLVQIPSNDISFNNWTNF